jgi:signal transduction histidine kinase
MIVAAVFCVFLIVVSVFTLIALQATSNWGLQEDVANNIVRNLNELTYYSNLFIVTLDAQATTKWNQAFNDALGNLSFVDVNTQTENALVQQTRTSLSLLRQNITSVGGMVVSSGNQTLANSFWTQVLPLLQSLNMAALSLSNLVNAKADQSQQLLMIWFFSLALILVAFVVVIYSQIYGPTVKSINHLQKQEKSLEENNRRLEDLVREEVLRRQASEHMATIGQTAGMVGHDIRNPLQAITGDLFLLRMDLASFPEGETKDSMVESLQSIEKNVSYINKIVSDLQDYARPLIPEFSEVVLSEVINDVLKTVVVPPSIEYSVKLSECPSKVRIDPLFLRRAITNLASNAIQAMPNGGKL